MQRGLRWRQGFSLVLLFTDYPQVADIFRQRLAGIYQARVSGLRLLHHIPQQPDELNAALLSQLLRPNAAHDAHPAPLWVDLHHGLNPAWAQARHTLLARLNEHRAVLIRQHQWPVIIVLPTGDAPDVPLYAPDLWAIRHQSLTLDNWLPAPAPTPPEAPASPAPPTPQTLPLTAAEQAKLDEWSRVKDLTPTDAGILRAGWAASEVCERHGRWRQKAQIDQTVLTLARKLADDTTGALRDLSVSLNNLGRVHQTLGQLDQARDAYQEALQLRRQRLQNLGETPEALRDLSVSLDNLGNVHRALGQLDQARKAYEQGLRIAVMLADNVADLPDIASLVDHFRQRLNPRA